MVSDVGMPRPPAETGSRVNRTVSLGTPAAANLHHRISVIRAPVRGLVASGEARIGIKRGQDKAPSGGTNTRRPGTVRPASSWAISSRRPMQTSPRSFRFAPMDCGVLFLVERPTRRPRLFVVIIQNTRGIQVLRPGWWHGRGPAYKIIDRTPVLPTRIGEGPRLLRLRSDHMTASSWPRIEAVRVGGCAGEAMPLSKPSVRDIPGWWRRRTAR